MKPTNKPCLKALIFFFCFVFLSLLSLLQHLHCCINNITVTSSPRQRNPRVTAAGYHFQEEAKRRPRVTKERFRKTKMMEVSGQTILWIQPVPGTLHYLLLVFPMTANNSLFTLTGKKYGQLKTLSNLPMVTQLMKFRSWDSIKYLTPKI